MSWKDWLYINKSDKIAIWSLLLIILILLSIAFFLQKPKRTEENSIEIPEDYKVWRAQLTEQREKERIKYYQKRKIEYPNYQAKMKVGETIELNSADTMQLKMIPGIGSGYSNRIVKYRNSLGGFAEIEQLNEVWGMDTYLYSQIIPFLTLEPKWDSIYINKDSFEKLLRHPYLNYKQVQVIIDIRTRKGDIKSLKRLNLLDEFSRRDLERLETYINFK